MIEIIPVQPPDATVEAPPSKAHTLRALFIASLAKGTTRLSKPLLAEDQLAAIAALRQFGAGIEAQENAVVVEGTAGSLQLPKKEVSAGNSGVTARFLPSFAALCPEGKVTITGSERIKERPVKDLVDALHMLGARVESVNKDDHFPLNVFGKTLDGGKTSLEGDVSGQYFSSILLAAPYAKEDLTIEAVGEVRSKPFIDITIDLMAKFRVKAENRGYKSFFVKAGQRYKARKLRIEGDYSNSAYFFAVAAITGGRVRVKNLASDSVQGDRIFPKLLKKMGCLVERGKNSITVEGGPLNAISVDMSNTPDIVQPLAVVAAFAQGKTVLKNIAHLRFKECDRLEATATELRRLGVKAEVENDSLVIEGSSPHAAEIETYNDHRMAMSFAIAGLAVPGVKIKNPECAAKSFPNFFDELQKLGGGK